MLRIVNVNTSTLIGCLLAALSVCGCSDGESPASTMRSLLDELDNVCAEVEQVRELTTGTDVEYRMVTQSEMDGLLLQEAEDIYLSDGVLIDQEVYVLLDMLGAGQDLRTIVRNALQNQASSFYDSRTGQLNVVDDGSGLGALDRVSFAHEFARALLHRHFDPHGVGLRYGNNSDARIAALSLVEGDATMSQTYYMYSGLDAADWESVAGQIDQSWSGGLDAAPRFVQVELAFPYGRPYGMDETEGGLAFVAALYNENEWTAVNRAYSDPPKSTEQVLHPEKYFEERDDPVEIVLPDLPGGLEGDWTLHDTDVMGELRARTYLETYIAPGMAGNAAAGWGGDRFAYLKDSSDDRMLVWRSTWDSTEDADEFFEAYSAFVYDKYNGQWESASDTGTVRQWTTTESAVYLGQNGKDILVVLAPNESLIDDVVVQFPSFMR